MKKEDGVISLEACIVLPVFLFLMLFLYGFIMMFCVQNEMNHALIQGVEKLAAEPYYLDLMDKGYKQNSKNVIPELWYGMSDKTYNLFQEFHAPSGCNFDDNLNYTPCTYNTRWYEDTLSGDTINTYFTDFLGTGSNVTKNIDEFNITDISFTGFINDKDGDGKNDEITVTMSYKYVFLFDMNGTITKDISVSTSAKLLRAKE